MVGYMELSDSMKKLSCVILITDYDFIFLSNIINQINNLVEIDKEIIVIDNRESNKDILKFPNVSIYSKGYNLHQFAAKKWALDIVTGDYIWFIDVDDNILNIPNISDINEDIIVFNYFSNRELDSNIKENSVIYDFDKESALNNIDLPCWNKFYKVDTLKKAFSLVDSNVDITVGEDYLVNILAVGLSSSIQYNKLAIYNYNFNLSSYKNANSLSLYKRMTIGLHNFLNVINTLSENENYKFLNIETAIKTVLCINIRALLKVDNAYKNQAIELFLKETSNINVFDYDIEELNELLKYKLLFNNILNKKYIDLVGNDINNITEDNIDELYNNQECYVERIGAFDITPCFFALNENIPDIYYIILECKNIKPVLVTDKSVDINTDNTYIITTDFNNIYNKKTVIEIYNNTNTNYIWVIDNSNINIANICKPSKDYNVYSFNYINNGVQYFEPSIDSFINDFNLLGNNMYNYNCSNIIFQKDTLLYVFILDDSYFYIDIIYILVKFAILNNQDNVDFIKSTLCSYRDINIINQLTCLSSLYELQINDYEQIKTLNSLSIVKFENNETINIYNLISQSGININLFKQFYKKFDDNIKRIYVNNNSISLFNDIGAFDIDNMLKEIESAEEDYIWISDTSSIFKNLSKVELESDSDIILLSSINSYIKDSQKYLGDYDIIQTYSLDNMIIKKSLILNLLNEYKSLNNLGIKAIAISKKIMIINIGNYIPIDINKIALDNLLDFYEKEVDSSPNYNILYKILDIRYGWEYIRNRKNILKVLCKNFYDSIPYSVLSINNNNLYLQTEYDVCSDGVVNFKLWKTRVGESDFIYISSDILKNIRTKGIVDVVSYLKQITINNY